MEKPTIKIEDLPESPDEEKENRLKKLVKAKFVFFDNKASKVTDHKVDTNGNIIEIIIDWEDENGHTAPRKFSGESLHGLTPRN